MKPAIVSFLFKAFSVDRPNGMWSVFTFQSLKEAKSELKRCKNYKKNWKDCVPPPSKGSLKGYTIYKIETTELE